MRHLNRHRSLRRAMIACRAPGSVWSQRNRALMKDNRLLANSQGRRYW